ncbi:hypothetical protein [Thalassoroseus pseudoceratinae]|uniref:hypothetical protein n=1 Tax=Thalassoroseus pseudoceratinae TaxID=2713176 RepID=UPI0014232ACE|nr:hypothetical protein [Thalassoroseus pseudoceratinae]
MSGTKPTAVDPDQKLFEFDWFLERVRALPNALASKRTKTLLRGLRKLWIQFENRDEGLPDDWETLPDGSWLLSAPKRDVANAAGVNPRTIERALADIREGDCTFLDVEESDNSPHIFIVNTLAMIDAEQVPKKGNSSRKQPTIKRRRGTTVLGATGATNCRRGTTNSGATGATKPQRGATEFNEGATVSETPTSYQNQISDLNNDHDACAAGLEKKWTRHVKIEELRSAEGRKELFDEAVRIGIRRDSETDRQWFYAVIARALARGKRNPCGLFNKLVSEGLWDHTNDADHAQAKAWIEAERKSSMMRARQPFHEAVATLGAIPRGSGLPRDAASQIARLAEMRQTKESTT